MHPLRGCKPNLAALMNKSIEGMHAEDFLAICSCLNLFIQGSSESQRQVSCVLAVEATMIVYFT
jgi:hypothetical protein